MAKRKMSDEQKAAASERLAKAREKDLKKTRQNIIIYTRVY